MWFHWWLTFARMYFDSCGGCVYMHVIVKYGLKMFACIVIEAVCFVFQGFIPNLVHYLLRT